MSTAVYAVGAKGRLLVTGQLAGGTVIRRAADLSLDRNPPNGDYTGPPAGGGHIAACGPVAKDSDTLRNPAPAARERGSAGDRTRRARSSGG